MAGDLHGRCGNPTKSGLSLGQTRSHQLLPADRLVKPCSRLQFLSSLSHCKRGKQVPRLFEVAPQLLTHWAKSDPQTFRWEGGKDPISHGTFPLQFGHTTSTEPSH